jgi:hypothetical protein
MKTFVRIGLVVLVVIGVAGVAIKQNAIASARMDHDTLLKQNEEATRLAEQNKDIERLRGEAGEVAKLREENKDLPKLRNEVRQLRRQSEELATLKKENELLERRIRSATGGSGEAASAGYITRAGMKDAGLATPEAAAQTLFWALTTGNVQRFAECMMNGQEALTGNIEESRQQMTTEYKDFPGLRVAGRQDISADEVELQLETSIGGGALPLKFKLTDTGWKVETLAGGH